MFSASLIILLVSCAVLCYVFFNYKKLSNFECDNEEMFSISKKISDGASLFLRCLYKYLVFFVLVVSIQRWYKKRNCGKRWSSCYCLIFMNFLDKLLHLNSYFSHKTIQLWQDNYFSGHLPPLWRALRWHCRPTPTTCSKTAFITTSRAPMPLWLIAVATTAIAALWTSLPPLPITEQLTPLKPLVTRHSRTAPILCA